ncbi:maltose regulon regulatory protein MalI [Abditibacteriota bacterium]|nr:maltose regulon regulatory protein MalI [Abditibacteriota bacterium]
MPNLPVLSSAASPLLAKSGGERRVTLKDVAAVAGVSHTVVSIILNGAKSTGIGISDAARERVVLAAEELGYRRNGSMSAMRSGRFGCVALLLSTDKNTSALPQLVLDGLHDELMEHNVHLSLFRLPDEQLTDPQRLPKILREWMADGMVVDYTFAIPPRLIELIDAYKLPAVWFNTWREFDCVRPDDFSAAKALGEHLLQLGHRQIVYVDFGHDAGDIEVRGEKSTDHYSAYDRFHGLNSAFEAAGVSMHSDVGRVSDFRGRLARIKELLGTHHPTAIVSYGGEGMDSSLMAARDLGIEVPSELSIAGFGSAGMEFLGVPFTAMIVPEREIGRELARTILQKIEDPEKKFPVSSIPFAFEVGRTCAPALNR